MNVGFTGSRRGMTEAQFEQVANLLSGIVATEASIFRHGLCIGCDCEASALAKELGFYVIAYPGFLPSNPAWIGSRGSFNGNDLVMPEKPFLIRDHDIVDESNVVIATPRQFKEQLRSGTWATVRYAEKTNIAIVVFPDGSIITRSKS